MRLKIFAIAFAVTAAMAMLAAPADAQVKKKRVVTTTGHTTFVSRDEDGRTRTRVIIQKRSYLDPGTETFPGERGDRDYAQLPGYHATSVLDNTPFGGNQSALPNVWTLPGKNNPWLQF
ncbi:MAG TPA: hypothetical protein VGF53_14950 [Pseudolabrys sp.]|jgi:hypothetical protein